MPTLNYIAKRIGILLAVFVALTILSTFQPIKDAHRAFYCSVGEVVFNVVNPYLYADFIPEAEEDTSHKYFNWDMTFNIYDTRLIQEKVNGRTKSRIKPTLELEQNHKQFTLVPLVFLISLFVASPAHWKSKLIRFPIALMIFYCFLGFYFSYTFEKMIQEAVSGSFKVDSIWDGLVWLFGFGQTHDAIFMIILFIWAILLGPSIWKKVTGQ